jgi:c-di-GMP-binding flagellar brake protein YcgR
MAELLLDSGLPPDMGSRPPDRRRFPRVKCQLPAEIKPSTSSFPIQGETTDVSVGGCYIATTFPLAVGTSIDFSVWVESTRITCRAVIRTSDPGVGNGLQFLNLDQLSTELLSHYLNSLEIAENELNAPTGAIHPHI